MEKDQEISFDSIRFDSILSSALVLSGESFLDGLISGLFRMLGDGNRSERHL